MPPAGALFSGHVRQKSHCTGHERNNCELNDLDLAHGNARRSHRHSDAGHATQECPAKNLIGLLSKIAAEDFSVGKRQNRLSILLQASDIADLKGIACH